jgi:hypothetical protein
MDRSPHPFGGEKFTGWFVRMNRNINGTFKNEGSLVDFVTYPSGIGLL